MIENWPALAVFIGVTFIVAMSGGIFRPGEWYKTLDKPSWTPPNWAFAPAWTLIYGTIAAAGYMVWQTAGPGAIVLPMILYGAQLVFNGAWSWLFFGLRRMDLALVDSVLMWLAILGTIVTFWPIDRVAALILVPYLLWVSFATALNFAMMRRNPAFTGMPVSRSA